MSHADRILAVGDIHGCSVALAKVLEMVQPCAGDTVVLLGDVVDRGPDTRGVIEQLLQLQHQCKLIFIMGNHEEMMRDALRGSFPWQLWLDNGGQATIDSYGGTVDALPATHLRLLLAAQPYWETEAEIFVHANLEAGVSLRNQDSTYLRWKHLGGNERPHRSGKRVICGHTPQADGRPWVSEGWVCLDTAACTGGYLSCLDVPISTVYQASQQGTQRTLDLH